MAKQLVIIGNRVIAHGTDCFADIGGAVVCLTNGKVYAGASIVECSTECPADIDTVGYEYHAGSFVPCAPYGKGKGTGYFMEVCPDCATPRNSGLLIKDINWGKIASVVCSCTNDIVAQTKSASFDFSVSAEELAKYSTLRYRIKAGANFDIGSPQEGFSFLTVGGQSVYSIGNIGTSGEVYSYETKEDVVIPFYLFNYGTAMFSKTTGEHVISNSWYTAKGQAVSPFSVTLTVPSGYYSGSTIQATSANVVIDLEGRK